VQQTWNGEVTQSTKNRMVSHWAAAVHWMSVKQREQFDGKVGLHQLDTVTIYTTFTACK